MAQLSDDCFAFAGPLMPIAEMERLIVERIAPVAEIERVRLREAAGRVLATDLAAAIDLPSFDNSAVDGYALRHADLDDGEASRLAVVDRIAAGQEAARGVAAGEAIRIFTGAPMPPGADTVVMQEDVTLEGDRVVVPPGLALGANRRLAGEDVRAGAVMLAAGRRLSPQDIALAAAQGMTTVPVRRRIAVALFSTGDEVIEPGEVRSASAIYDANRFLLLALLEKLGARVTDLGILRDEPDTLAAALAGAA
ncbi:MAG: molybdopterin molybdotransferase MoeA, partial [Rhodoplanes sp.]